MIRLIETRNFRSLRAISQPLEDFHVLVGPNASGKTTFLDVISFLSDLVGHGLDYAIAQRTSNFDDLTFGGEGGKIELAVELEIPEEMTKLISSDTVWSRVRYEVAIGLSDNSEIIEIQNEWISFLSKDQFFKDNRNKNYFPDNYKFEWLSDRYLRESEEGLINNQDTKEIILKLNDWVSIFHFESIPLNMAEGFEIKTSRNKSVLDFILAYQDQFPISLWLRESLVNGVQAFVLDSQKMQRPSPSGQGLRFKTDGSNLPWVIENLKTKRPEAYRDWIAHVQTALPDLTEVLTIVRDEDRHRYLKVRYANGIEVPSWLVSDGTLRLLALTLPAYLSDFEGIYLIEEPENGIHPRAIETVFQSLSSVYNAQILLATHSPVILSMVEPKDVLCFAKTEEGITDIVRGDEHPNLRGWKRDTNLSILFAAGVLS